MMQASPCKTISLPLAALESLVAGLILEAADGSIAYASPRALALLGDQSPEALIRGLGGAAPAVVDTDHGCRLALRACPLVDEGLTLWVLEDLTPATRAAVLRDDALRAMSHDLRAPIGTLLTLAEGAADGTLAANAETFARVAHFAGLALARADSVLRMLRADAATAERFELFDLQQIAWEAADECWQDARRRQIEIVVEVPDGETLVRGDLDMLRQALTHLLRNAVLHGPAGQRVSITVAAQAQAGYSVTVRDHGGGLDAVQASVLLAATPLAPVRGLGLATVRRICDAHGARLQYRHDADGASVTLHLPAAS
ncbi:HAMP domain-containing histidine kinase [Niveibacterium sp. 24ML]|uniref:sensor histidine kinase n=1 Tax=Niveibacterium sp. 24ML TaxID=2985512 RepID=UPI002271C1FC|nr:HAMP domain-containing sensor histidine kinase [Niveibacterium sp. 24ML]MCX9156230.1 HAMP domain-containing histidine kinase [Niveibacterium sp. 24ML]